jgi:hypothetical protein
MAETGLPLSDVFLLVGIGKDLDVGGLYEELLPTVLILLFGIANIPYRILSERFDCGWVDLEGGFETGGGSRPRGGRVDRILSATLHRNLLFSNKNFPPI